MGSVWIRPDTVPYPTIWSHFEGRREIDRKIPKFWIQDIAEDQEDDVVNYMLTGFHDEPLCKYSHAADDEISVAEGREYYKKMLINKLGLVCMTKDAVGNSVIAGIGCMARIAKTDPPFRPTGAAFMRLRDMMTFVYAHRNPYDYLQVEEYLCDRGIYVLPEYRRQGICYELLKSWVSLGTAVDQKVIVGTFTSVYSQRAAERVGFQDLITLAYADIERVSPSFSLPGIQEHTEYLKVLYIRV